MSILPGFVTAIDVFDRTGPGQVAPIRCRPCEVSIRDRTCSEIQRREFRIPAACVIDGSAPPFAVGLFARVDDATRAEQ